MGTFERGGVRMNDESRKNAELYEAIDALTNPTEAKPTKPRIEFQRASDVPDGEVQFIWKPYILRGDVTIIAAAGGTGKSFAVCGIIAALSNGRFPIEPDCPFDETPPLRTLFITSEDHDFVIKDRLQKAGADLDRVIIVNPEKSIKLHLANIDRQPDTTDLETLIQDAGNPDLVIFDPLHAFLNGVKMTEQSTVRPFMQALANVAKKYNCGIIDVAHVSKRTAGMNANDAILGATDIVNASRSVLRVISDETGTNPNRRVIVHTKSNYAAAGDSIAFEIDEDGRLTWAGKSSVTKDDLETAARNNKSVSEYLANVTAGRRAAAYVADQLETLALKQTQKRQFYSFETLRTMGIGGKPDIVPNIGELNRRGIMVLFPENGRREANDKKVKRGIELVRV